MADYTKQIFEMLGVEPNEKFKIMGIMRNDVDYYFDTELNLCVYNYYDAERKISVDYDVRDILSGSAKILKTPKITKTERLAIDYARACGFNWIAKDKNKTLAAFKEKPQKGTKEWLNTTNDLDDWIELYLPISFIHWEDEEPFYIGVE